MLITGFEDRQDVAQSTGPNPYQLFFDQLYSPEGRKTEEKKHTHKLN